MDLQSLKQRIQKLLNLADSATYNPKEAAVALSKAMELANEYNLSLTDFDSLGLEIESQFIDCVTDTYEHDLLTLTRLSRFYRVEVLLYVADKKSFKVLGTSSDIYSFIRSFNYIKGYFDLLHAEKFSNPTSLFYKYRNDKVKKNEYYIGFITGVLEYLDSKSTSLVLVKSEELNKALSELATENGNLPSLTISEDRSILNLGYIDGGKIMFNNSIKESN